MTCIAGLVHCGAVWMAGDRAAVENSHYLVLSGSPKVFRRGPYLIGYTSSFRMGQLLQHSGDLPEPDPRRDLDSFMVVDFIEAVRRLLKDGGYVRIHENREESGVFLVGVQGELFVCDDDFNVRTFGHRYGAIGCGVSVALGSLHATARLGSPVGPHDRLTFALEAASEFVTGVRAPFDVLDLPAGAEGQHGR